MNFSTKKKNIRIHESCLKGSKHEECEKQRNVFEDEQEKLNGGGEKGEEGLGDSPTAEIYGMRRRSSDRTARREGGGVGMARVFGREWGERGGKKKKEREELGTDWSEKGFSFSIWGGNKSVHCGRTGVLFIREAGRNL